jgi:hypothetical protein
MSNRIVWPYAFTLKLSQQITPQRRPVVLGTTEVSADPYGDLGIPVDLRWVTLPELGFPREPFRVWRRARVNIPANDIQTLVGAPTQIDGASDLPFPAASAGTIYMAAFEAAPTTGGVLVIAPYDLRGMTIPGLLFEATYAQASLFICPGMAGLRVVGEGTMSIVLGVDQQSYANLPDWEIIQVVGLPTQPADNLGAAYASGEKQGFDIAATTGVIAAEERMALSHFFQAAPPASSDPTFPVPAWPKSNPTQYIKNLRSGTNLFPMIVKCLQNTNDANPAQMQSNYLETVNNLDGIIQANIPGQTPDPAQTTTVDIPVVGLSMMSVSTDSDAALALGYGTVDIPLLDAIAEVLAYYASIGTNPGASTLDAAIAKVMIAESLIPYDYMVTGQFVLPFGVTLQMAALSQPALPVQPITGFNAALLNSHAVLTRDTGAEVAVELTWDEGLDPQAAGLLVSRSANQSEYLNTARPTAVGGYDPYLGLPPGTPPANADPQDLLPNLQDAAGTAPVQGSATTQYMAAGIDVFARWSPWTETDITLNASSVTVPGLNKVSWIAGTLPASGTKVPYSLQMEVLWNWADRSPGEIAISGNFVPIGTGLGPTAYLTGLGMNNDLAAGPPLVLSWDYSGFDPTTVAPGTILPTVDAAHPGSTVTLLNDVSGVANNQVMHYQVTVPGFTLDYAGSDQIALALYATATERVRPGYWSSPIDPNAPPSPPAPAPTWIGRVATANNPLPPTISFNPPEISWTALPDAYSLAHGVLTWSGGGPVAGYMVWEATESGLLGLLSAPDPAPTDSLVTRGTALKTLIANNFNASLQGFTRLNTDPITETSYEVEIPGNSAVLYVYMVSAVSTQGVESQRTAANSPIAVFGVPQRVVPGQPRMRLRGSDAGNTNGIQVIALAIEGDVLEGRVIVAGYRVFRCRSAALSADAGLMGPPVFLENDPGWTPYSEMPLWGGTTATGFAIVDTTATPSWYPWYYRVQAIGVQDLTNGMYSGKSLPSQVQSAYNEPPDAPLIGNPALTQGSGAALVTFTSDLPIPASPLGASLVELLQSSPDPNHAGRFVYKSIKSEAPDAVTQGTLALPTPWWTPGPGHPIPIPPGHPYHPPNLGPALARSAPDTQGTFTLYVLVPYAAADQNTYTVRLTDPLGRQSSYSF